MGNWTVVAPVTTKWAPLHIWIKLPGGRASLNTTQSPSWSWICLIGSVTQAASLCLLSLLAAAWRTWERWRRRKQKRRRRGIYSRRSLAGWRAHSLVCIRPVSVLLWSHIRPPATPPRPLSLSPRLTSQLQSSTTRKLYDNRQPTMTKTDSAHFLLSLLPPIPYPHFSPHLPPPHFLLSPLKQHLPPHRRFFLPEYLNLFPLLPPFPSQ